MKPSDLGLIEAVWIHHKELGKPPKSRAQESTKENRIRHKLSTRRTRLKRNQNPGGHKEGRASFPIQSQYKDSKIHSSNPTLEEKGRKNIREGEWRTGGRGRWRRAGRGSILFQALRERERERERERGIYGAHAGVQNTLRLKLETKTPVWAKPEIST